MNIIESVVSKFGKKVLSISLVLAIITSMVSVNMVTSQAETANEGYVIENISYNNITVIIQHLSNSTNEALYSEDNKTLSGKSKILNYKKANNYTVAKVVIGSDTYTSASQWSKIQLDSNKTVKVYYSPITAIKTGSTTFYDYVVDADSTSTSYKTNKSINNNSLYKNTANSTNHFNIGSYEDTNRLWYYVNNSFKNNQVYNKSVGHVAYTGTPKILNGLVADSSIPVSQWAVDFNLDEPGLFTNEEKSIDNTKVKSVYNDYSLEFSGVGDTYTLTRAIKPDGKTTASSAGSDFFPLDDYTATDKINYNYQASGHAGIHNYFYGMRYDVSFTLGDYVGTLNYTFSGDDDMWVLLDGEVVLDIGGIHAKVDGSVNLWNYIKDSNNNYDKYQSHTLTVLYMERGGYASNCSMNFTIPNANIINVSNTTTAHYSVNKVNAKNEVLSGAIFTLTGNDGNPISYTGITNAQGQYMFENLVEGTYTLTETHAPDGYALNPTEEENVYILKVENVNGVLIPTLYKHDGTTMITDNKIINYIANDFINSNKIVTCTDWDERKYEITLTASSKAQTSLSTSVKKDVDIMLVLDKSLSMNQTYSNNNASYTSIGKYNSLLTNNKLEDNQIYYYKIQNNKYGPMKKIGGIWMYYNGSSWKNIANSDNTNIYTWNSRMSGLKVATSNFINSMASSSPNSLVGVATFSTYGTLDAKLSKITDTPNELLKKVNQIEAVMYTAPGAGLQLAYNELTSSNVTNDNRAKYVILFTDGDPRPDTNEALAEVEAKALKDKDITIFTVGLGLNEVTKNWLSEKIATDSNHALVAEDAEGLNKIFDSIQQSITTGSAIGNATITDVIDNRFEITDSEKDRLELLGATVTSNDDGTTTVTWTDQDIPYTDGGKNNWIQTINVVAKNSYIGGNNITTNVNPDSSITVEEFGTVVFPQPSVNVKVKFGIEDAQVAAFKGETYLVNDGDQSRLFDLVNTKGYDGTGTLTNLSASDFTYAWYKDEACLTPINFNDLKTIENNCDTTYYLKVTYNAKQPTIASNINSGGNVNGDASNTYTVTATNNSDSTKNFGTLDIKFVPGQLQITKTLDKQYTNISQINSNQTFIFKIEQYGVTNEGTKGDLVRTFYQTISFDANEKEVSKSALISDLEKGFYTVSEETTWSTKYMLQATLDNYGDVFQEGENMFIGSLLDTNTNDIKTYYGLDKNCINNVNVKGDKAEVSFENQLKTWNKWYSDTGSAKNVFKQNKLGQ